MRTRQTDGHLHASRGASGRASPARMLDFWPPELGDHPVLLPEPRLWRFAMVAPAN